MTMRPGSRKQHEQRKQKGFTLIEAVIAIAILAVVALSMLGFRTDAIIDATEARHWLIAREQAQMILSELKAGHREMPPENGMTYAVPGFENDQDKWWYEVALGEEFISEVETRYTEGVDSEQANQARERMEWQKEREDIRGAGRAGMSVYDYRAKQRADQETYGTDSGTEETPIAEDEFLDVAVFVFFPKVRPSDDGVDQSYFVLRARISTLALNGMTPEEAESLNESGSGTGSASGSGSIGSMGKSGSGR